MYKSILINYEQNNITDKSIKQTVNGISLFLLFKDGIMYLLFYIIKGMLVI